MIKHIWSLVCKDAKVEANSNNLSIIDVVENVQIGASIPEKEIEKNKNKPLVAPFPMQFVSVFFRDTKKGNQTFDTELRVMDPKGKVLGTFTNQVMFKEGLDRMRTMMKFDTFALTTSGVYLFDIYMKENNKLTKVSSVPLTVQLDLKTI